MTVGKTLVKGAKAIKIPVIGPLLVAVTSMFAGDQLGDIVFVDLPEEGTSIAKGESFGSVESVKAVEDMYAPVGGEIVHRNNSVMASPEELQNDPHGEGWLLIIRPDNPDQLKDLMDSQTYSKKISA